MILPTISRRTLSQSALLLLALALAPNTAAQTAGKPLAKAQPAKQHVDRGNQLLEKRDWDGALREYREAIRLKPNHAEAHYGVGRALGEKKDLEGAQREFREAIRLKPDYAEAHNGLGWILGTKGDLDGAIREYREAVRLKRDYARPHGNLGWALSQKGDLNGALLEYREAARLKPEDSDAHINLGWALSQKGDADGALREYREAVRLKPDDPDAHAGLGGALSQKGDADGAVREYREAVRLKPDDPDTHAGLGATLSQKGDLDDALREYREVVRLKPDDPGARDNLGIALIAKGEWNAALQEYREAIRRKPNDPDAHINLGVALAKKDDWDAAIREYREAVRLKPDYATAHFRMGNAWAHKNNLKDAIAEHKEAIRLKPDYVEAHARLANDFDRAGDRDGEIWEAREAIRLKPDYAPAHFYLGRGLEYKSDRRAALAEYRKAVELSPHDSAYGSNYDRLLGEVRLLPAGWSASTVRAFTLCAALVPSFLLLGYFRARDLYPEPAKVLWMTFGLGVLTVYPVLLLDGVLAPIVKMFHGPISHGLAEALFTAAIPEELLKFAVLVLFCARHKEFDEPMDGIVYGAVVSLGFATFENYAYVSDGGIATALIRAFMSVPGHAFMGAVMGYFVGQWRFGLPGKRGMALLNAYLVPVALHWMFDFPLLAREAAGKLTGAEKQLAVSHIAPFMYLPVVICVLEAIWAVRLVNRLHREQIQITRDAAAAAAAQLGAMDLVALVNAPAPPPKALPAWTMTVVGGLVATGGAFLSLLIVVFGLAQNRADPNVTLAAFGALVGGTPLLLGIMLFVSGVKRIHARRRGMQAPPQTMAAAAGA
jgi:tetratricopeptide (TPR) repeat protein